MCLLKTFKPPLRRAWESNARWEDANHNVFLDRRRDLSEMGNFGPFLRVDGRKDRQRGHHFPLTERPNIHPRLCFFILTFLYDTWPLKTSPSICVVKVNIWRGINTNSSSQVHSKFITIHLICCEDGSTWVNLPLTGQHHWLQNRDWSFNKRKHQNIATAASSQNPYT